MPGMTLVQAEAGLAAWIAADIAVSEGQDYAIGSRRLTLANAAIITEKINFYTRMVARIKNGGIKVRGIVPLS